MSDRALIELATQLAHEKGFSTAGLGTFVQETQETWDVTFSKPMPGQVGGDGFLVRLRKPKGELIEILKFQ